MLLKLECDNKLLERRLKLLTTFHQGQCRDCAPKPIQASTKDVVVKTCCYMCATEYAAQFNVSIIEFSTIQYYTGR